jgi:uncharacterized protein (DUF983 family)
MSLRLTIVRIMIVGFIITLYINYIQPFTKTFYSNSNFWIEYVIVGIMALLIAFILTRPMVVKNDA